MRAKDFLDTLAQHPIIASVKDEDGLSRALKSECGVIFTLYGDLMNIGDILLRIKAAGKVAFAHIDLIEGLAPREVSVEYIAAHTRADGILSTKVPLIRCAAAHNLLAIQRYFLLDSMAFNHVERQFAAGAACAMEVLPGGMPKVIARVVERVHVPIITGGLIQDKEDVLGVLKAGATAVSSTNPEIWFL